jgi:hypothetical protein
MPDKPRSTTAAEEPEKEKGRRPEEKPNAASGERSYYYDDAHGYEDFDPDAESDDEDK